MNQSCIRFRSSGSDFSKPMRERAQQYMDDPSLVRAIVADGCDKARKLAQETMRDVREAMGLSYN